MDSHNSEDVRDQTWSARQKELMKTWRQDAESVAGVCPTCGLTMSMFHPVHPADEVRVHVGWFKDGKLATIVGAEVNGWHDAAESLGWQPVFILRPIDGSECAT